jgi:peptidoglycan/LPS O-acetylase OafA/YrhL
VPTPPARHRGNLATLDMLRGGAALYVAAYHSVGALTPSGLSFDTEGGSARLLRQGNLLGLAGFGFYAVLAFFVLSGFVIHLRQAERPAVVTERRKAWLADYGWRRAMRVYPPLVAALVVTAGLTALGDRLFPRWPWPPGSLTDAGNVLVPVQGAATFANGGALWSVAFEVWFYVAYIPIALLVLRPGRRPMGRVLVASLVVAAALFVVREQSPQLVPARLDGLWTIAIYLPAWAAGAFLAELYASGAKLSRRRWALTSAGLIVVVVASFHSGNQLRPPVDLLWCAAFCLLIAALTLGPERDWVTRPVGRWAASTASWSYSLYLVHLPVIYFAQAAFGYDGGERVTNPLVVLAVFLVAVATGWLFSLAVERPSRRLVSRRARSGSRSPVTHT